MLRKPRCDVCLRGGATEVGLDVSHYWKWIFFVRDDVHFDFKSAKEKSFNFLWGRLFVNLFLLESEISNL